MHSMPKTILICHDQLDQVQSVMKAKQDNDVTDRIGAIQVENETKLPWLIKLGELCDENYIGQRHNRSYRCELR